MSHLLLLIYHYIRLLFLLLFLLPTLIINISQSLHQTFIYDTNPQYYVAINNEFPELIPAVYDLPKPGDSKRLEALTHIIGYLPFAEQAALLKSFQSTGALFTPATYFASISLINTKDSSYDINIFTDNSKAISSYLTESVKRLNKGLGCYKRIIHKYGHTTTIDLNKITYAYKAMNDMLRAQTQVNICTAKFYEILHGIMIKRRTYLFEINAEQININDDLPSGFTPNPKLVYTDDKYRKIAGIHYNEGDKNIIVKAFKAYAICQHSYKNLIGRRAMEIQLQIGQCKPCVDRDNPNPFAGNSSMTAPWTGITYNRHKEQIGINNGSLIRNDHRTNNNYLLNYGFGLGKDVLYDDKVVVASYPKEYGKEWFDKRLKGIEAMTDPLWDNVRNLLMSIMMPNAKYKPMGNLHTVLLNAEGIAINADNNKLIALRTVLKAFEGKEQVNAVTNGVYECISESVCTCTSTGTGTACPLEDITAFTGLTLRDLTLNDLNFGYESISLHVVNINNFPPILITKAYSTITGDVFDVYSQGVSLGTLTMSTIQSCFGVFTSGGKNDKDACRHVTTHHCGQDLDYQCKKSGLYDYINEHPVSSTVFPYNCTKGTDDECLVWIDKHFISGTIAIKSSGFSAYDLNAQASIIEKPLKNENDNYRPAKVSSYPYNTAVVSLLEALIDDVIKKEMIYVYKSSPYNNIEDLHTVEGEKELVSIMILTDSLFYYTKLNCLWLAIVVMIW